MCRRPDSVKITKPSIAPKAKSVVAMALANAFHLAGYEFARSSVLAMFTSHRTGFQNASALPFATGCVAPFSVGLLWLYTLMLGRSGPQKALLYSTLLCAFITGTGGFLLRSIDANLADDGEQDEHRRKLYHTISQIVLLFMFVLQSGFVQLLYTQHWAFLGSIQSRQEGAVWFSPIAGIGSISSTAAAFAVSPLVEHAGLGGLLWGAALMLVVSACCGEYAYCAASQHGFELKAKEQKLATKVSSGRGEGSPLQKARRLFQRVPVLGALCSEVVTCQCLSSLISFLFVTQVKQSIPSDDLRAGFTANCFAWINAVSGVLQFLALPLILKHIDTRTIWLFMPCAMLACTILLSMKTTASLEVITASFFTMKTMEYSLRGVANEMVFVSLDFESRFVGKEIIGLFANRVGKSLMAIGLFAVTAANGAESVGIARNIALASNGVATLWLGASYSLTRLMPVSERKGRLKTA